MTILLTLVLGVVAVLQGAINRQVSSSWGLAPAIILNNCVVFAAGIFLYAAVKLYPQMFPDAFADKAGFTRLSWYYFLPGLFGFVLVAGIPFAIGKVGALNVFVGIVSAQMATSLIWDRYIENMPFTWPRILGATLTIFGVMVLRIKV